MESKVQPRRAALSIRAKMLLSFLMILLICLLGTFGYVKSTGILLDFNADEQEKYYESVQLENQCKRIAKTVTGYIGNQNAETEAEYASQKERITMTRKRLVPADAEEQSYLRALENLIESYFIEADRTMAALKEKQRTYYIPYYRSQKIQDYLSNYFSAYIEYLLERDAQRYDELSMQVSRGRTMIGATMVLLIGLVLAFIWTFTRGITEPLSLLVKASREMASGNLEAPLIPEKTQDEIGELTHSFNLMQTNIRGYVHELKVAGELSDKLHQEELKNVRMHELLREAQLSALRAQINPHFLFNTLNVISRAAVYDDPHVAEHLIADLAALLRYSLGHVDQQTTLAEEIAIVDRYIKIQQYRFGDRVRYEKRIEPGCERALMPSMIFQPLVENAVSHGTEKMENGGRVVIGARHSQNRLILFVYDDGAGISEEQRKKIYEASEVPEVGREKHIGILNVMKRVRMETGGKMEIVPNLRRGTLIRIELEYRETEEAEHV